MLLGNKSDLEESRQVSLQDVQEAIKERGIRHLEVSARTGEQVGQAFEQLAEMLMQVYPREEQRSEPMAVVEDIRKKRREFQLQAGQTEAKKKSSCC